MTFETAETTMWRLVQLYTGRVGYQRGVKSEGLSADPPVIDCSGWTRLLLTQAMRAENEAAGRAVFGAEDVEALQAWSDRIIQEIETRTGFVLEGREITALSLPRCATIGLKMGNPPGRVTIRVHAASRTLFRSFVVRRMTRRLPPSPSAVQFHPE